MSEQKKLTFHVLNVINDELKYLKDYDKRFLGDTSRKKRVIDMIFLGAARAIYLRQSLIRESKKKNHEKILKNIHKDLGDSDDIIFLSQLFAYYSKIKSGEEDPHHAIFNIQDCLDIVRCYFESSWNLGSPTYQEIITKEKDPEDIIIKELIEKTKDIEIKSEEKKQ